MPEDRSFESPRDDFGPITVPSEKDIRVGDTRDHNYDSPFWGFVDEKDVEVRVVYIY